MRLALLVGALLLALVAIMLSPRVAVVLTTAIPYNAALALASAIVVCATAGFLVTIHLPWALARMPVAILWMPLFMFAFFIAYAESATWLIWVGAPLFVGSLAVEAEYSERRRRKSRPNS